MTRVVSSIPEGARAYQGHRAGLVSRLLATGVDLAVTVTTLVVLYAAWSVLLFVLDPRGFPSRRRRRSSTGSLAWLS